MSKNLKLTVVLLMAAAIIITIPLVIVKDSEFGGTDDMAEEMISEINPNYEPWFENIFELPGGETESLLFCLQAALGAGILGFGFGYLSARKKYSSNKE